MHSDPLYVFVGKSAGVHGFFGGWNESLRMTLLWVFSGVSVACISSCLFDIIGSSSLAIAQHDVAVIVSEYISCEVMIQGIFYEFSSYFNSYRNAWLFEMVV